MLNSLSARKRSLLLFALVGLLGSLMLTACDGTAFIDINYDPTEGVGNIVITGDQDEQPAQQTNGDTNMSQLLLFGLVVVMLLGTVAIVASVASRRRS